MKRLPIVYIVTKDAAGDVVPIPPEGLLLEDYNGSGWRLRTDAAGRALELPPALADYAEKEQMRKRRAGMRNVRTTVTMRAVGAPSAMPGEERARYDDLYPRKPAA